MLDDWKVERGKAVTIENWAPLDEIHPTPPTTPGREHGLAGRPVLLYAGTLGLKHNPELLWRAAERLAASRSWKARVVVVSEGWAPSGSGHAAPNEPEVPLDDIALSALRALQRGAGQRQRVVAAILEPEAGVFSVPSKVLSYLAAGRGDPLGAPAENLASRTVAGSSAGEVVDPDDPDGFAERAVALLRDPARCHAMGGAAVRTPSVAFDIDRSPIGSSALPRGADRRGDAPPTTQQHLRGPSRRPRSEETNDAHR